MDFMVFREFLDKLEANLAKAVDRAKDDRRLEGILLPRAEANAKYEALREVAAALKMTLYEMSWRD